MTTPKKIGLMGCGAVASYGHVPAILKVPGLQLYSIFDPSLSQLKHMQEEFKIPHVFTNAEEFFKSGIEAVTITSPAPCHKDNVLDCARHHLPALCEKPLASTAADARVMIDAMKSAGQALYVGFCYRFSPCAIKIRDLVREGAIGEVRSLRLIYNWGAHGKFETTPDGKKIIQKRRHDRMLEGGPMIDCGTHQIDLAAFWLDSKVVHFSGHGAWVDEYEAPDHMWLHLDHENGAHTVVEISYSFHHTAQHQLSEFVYELIGTKGVIRYDRERKSFTMENGSGTHTYEFDHEKNFTGMYEAWHRALLAGKSNDLTSAEDGLRVAEIASLATEDAIRHRKE